MPHVQETVSIRGQGPLKVYLDMNIWIALGQARHNRKSLRPGSERALSAVIESVHAGTAIFPISAAHVMEFFKTSRLERRQRLGSLLREVTRGWAIASSSHLLRDEISRAFTNALGLPQPTPSTPVFAKYGIPFAYGLHGMFLNGLTLSKGSKEIALASLGSDQSMSLFLSDENEEQTRTAMAHIRALEEQQAAKDERARQVLAAYGADVARRAYLARLTEDMIGEIMPVVSGLGVDLFELMRSDQTRARMALDSIPQFDVEATLFVRRNALMQRNISRTDMMDLAHLTLAIPYCNLVVTEGIWTTLSEHTGVGVKYGAKVISDLNVLADELEQLQKQKTSTAPENS